MTRPANQELYDKVKKEIYAKHPKHSAYRSALLVKEYKQRGGRYKGTKDSKQGLARWFDEKWKNQRGEEGYKSKSDVYRPTVRVTKDTPTTFSELTKTQVAKAQAEKARTGRVKKYDK